MPEELTLKCWVCFVNHLTVTVWGGWGVEFINHFLFRGLDLNRNVAKVSESLKMNDPRMAKLLRVIFYEVTMSYNERGASKTCWSIRGDT